MVNKYTSLKKKNNSNNREKVVFFLLFFYVESIRSRLGSRHFIAQWTIDQDKQDETREEN